ncbi:hypothetical protein NEUTE1DRAFT_35452 [Neurospora tetrasperma FGSC 2508]|uniref:Uncharacterized protein n=1 Tax=Neurospora tetrasperma (strain FGSC 2508 / ATCC MYA-4615 / P0657) TaxID=510951 RepID=F8MBT9_NEUT8|nr:uncharacterized protein NEUTE1DRAFT_35452 [Neurospora tetrasperma FGSC 2508]EGO60347.1 hypothetical protein NEUTE1DRAFT_35452 [Neurospora tetrasperma FGSC 2508]EGZ75678.1 hypothetical protein NEUTE2DRAFT_126632 [Neurospora tetrasperma FGSC 2509]
MVVVVVVVVVESYPLCLSLLPLVPCPCISLPSLFDDHHFYRSMNNQLLVGILILPQHFLWLPNLPARQAIQAQKFSLSLSLSLCVRYVSCFTVYHNPKRPFFLSKPAPGNG